LSSGKAVKGIYRRTALSTAGLALALLAIATGIYARGRVPGAATLPGPSSPAIAQAAGLPGPVLLLRGSARVTAATRPARVKATTGRAPRAATASTGFTRSRRHSPRQVARSLVRRFGWQPWQFHYLDRLWAHESGWNRYASNPDSGAYGIPQAVPGNAMASAGPDWRWNARTQILWGMRYIRGRYGSLYGAWQHECSYGWY
jgi:hypothetical protein